MGRPRKNPIGTTTNTSTTETKTRVKRLTNSISKCKVDTKAKTSLIVDNNEPIQIKEAPKRGRPRKNPIVATLIDLPSKQMTTTTTATPTTTPSPLPVNNTPTNTLYTSSRPRREASIKASALIIQTNEIEKSSRLMQQQQQQQYTTTSKINQQQVKRDDQSTIEIKSDIETDSGKASSMKTNKKSSVNGATNVKVLNLTVDNLAEHTKRAANLGPYNNNTRDYILKWTDGWAYTNEKPFPEPV